MGKHLVLVGGGHAHMTCLLKLRSYVERGHNVTLISPSEYQYYSGMGPGMLAGTYRPQQVRFNVGKMVEDREGVFIEDRVVRIDPDGHALFLKSGSEIAYDVVSFNTGSRVPTEVLMPSPQQNVFPVKPIVGLLSARERIREAIERTGRVSAVVAGGGPAGVEVAGNVWRAVTDLGGEPQITLVAGAGLLGAFPAKVRRLAREGLVRRGIQVIEGRSATSLAGGHASLDDGSRVPYDVAFAAVGVKPYPMFEDSGLLTGPDGGLLVNDFLQSMAHPEVFGGGDCISLEGVRLARVGVHAVRQNPVLHWNLMAALEGRAFRRFKPSGSYLLILNMGDGAGVLRKWGIVAGGGFAFRFKDFIDRRFMRRFQVSGELSEPDA